MHRAGHQVGEARRVANEDQVGLASLVLRQRVRDRRPVELELRAVARHLGTPARHGPAAASGPRPPPLPPPAPGRAARRGPPWPVRSATSKAPLTTRAPA